MSQGQDEIYERYLSRAISEINELGDAIARCDRAAHSGQAPVVARATRSRTSSCSSTTPGRSELAEGVAFYGRLARRC